MVTYLTYMILPLAIYIILELFYHRPIVTSDILKRRYLILCGIVVFFMIACMHHSVGSGDASWYYKNWQYLSQISFDRFLDVWFEFDIEKGYLLIVWVLSHLFENPQFIFVFYGLLVAISIGRFLYINCESVALGMVMFNCLGLWGFMVQGIRQGIAMCICLYAIEYCKQRNLLKFITLIIIAMLFHTSAIIFVITYILPNLKITVKGLFAVAVGMMICLFLMDGFFEILNFIMNETYTTSDLDRTSGGFVSLIIYIMIIVASIMFYGGKQDNSLDVRLFFYMLCCGCVFFMMRYSVNTIAQRMSYYYMFSQIPMLSMVLGNLKSRDRTIATIIVVCLCLGITIYKAGYTPLVPYLFFWQV